MSSASLIQPSFNPHLLTLPLAGAYVDSIQGSVAWLGHTPFKVTYSSDYFGEPLRSCVAALHQLNLCEKLTRAQMFTNQTKMMN